MYSIINVENNEVIRSYNNPSDAAWMKYSLQRRGYHVEVQQPPGSCIRDLISDIDFVDLGEFASCIGEGC